LREHVPTILDIMSDTIQNSVYLEDEIQDQRVITMREYDEFWSQPDQFLADLLHEAAFPGCLSNPSHSPPLQIAKLNREHLMIYARTYLIAPRLVLVGVGVNHDELVQQAKIAFSTLSTTPPNYATSPISSSLSSKYPRATSTGIGIGISGSTESGTVTSSLAKAVGKLFSGATESYASGCVEYRGGEKFLDFDLWQKRIQAGTDDELKCQYQQELTEEHKVLRRSKMEEVAHFSLAFPAPSFNHSDFHAAFLLQMLMGGGGSFSSGGPGKGMHSRLYSRVLNKYWWVQHVNMFYWVYSDTALMGLYGSTDNEHFVELVQLMFHELDVLTKEPIPKQDLLRAKNQLKSAIFSATEQRSSICEDIGRQVLAFGKFESPEEQGRLIDQIDSEKLNSVVRKLVSCRPSVAAFANPETLKELETKTYDWSQFFEKKKKGRFQF